MDDLDRLEALAKSAIDGDGGWYSDQTLASLGIDYLGGLFIEAANPATVIALIARLRAAEADAAKWRHVVERSRQFEAEMTAVPGESGTEATPR